jgi:pteridine reductase
MQKNPLTEKVALVTGAARRVGASIALSLHKEKMNVVLHYNASEVEALSLCDQLNEERPHSAIAIQADLSIAESEKALIQRAKKEWGRLDALINNASRFYRTNMGKITEYAWNDLMISNLKAPFFLSQAAAPFLKETQGCIVNIIDIYANFPLRDYAVYCISKSGLAMATKILAKELGPEIRVNAVSPGSILWPEGKNSLSEAEKQNIIHQTALQRCGTPADIAKAVLFFIREGDYITGQILSVDGGRVLYS